MLNLLYSKYIIFYSSELIDLANLKENYPVEFFYAIIVNHNNNNSITVIIINIEIKKPKSLCSIKWKNIKMDWIPC